jgi:hypothetical protein
MTLNESIVEEAALTWFGELGYAIAHGPDIAPGERAADDVFGLPPRISIPSSLNLNLSSPNLRSSASYLVARSSVLPASSYALKDAMP